MAIFISYVKLPEGNGDWVSYHGDLVVIEWENWEKMMTCQWFTHQKSEKILMQWRLQHFDTKNRDLTNQTYDGISGIIPGYNWMPPI